MHYAMSALCQKRTSALLFNDFVSECEECRRDREAEFFCRKFHWQIAGLGTP